MSELTLYYDGHCPLCVREMDHLRAADTNQRLTLVDIQMDGFSERYPGIDPVAASNILHATTAEGELLLGLDVTYRAWALVGKGFWIAPLRWPIIRWFADKAYLWFARNRYRVSGWLTGQERCDTCGPKGCSLDDDKTS